MRWDKKTIIFLFIFLLKNINAQIPFISHLVSDSSYGARSVFSIDLNSDGLIDIVSASNEDNTIAWYENDGNENFKFNIISKKSNGAHSVFAYDINNDEFMVFA